MYYNGHDYKNLREYVEVGLGLHPNNVDMEKEENWHLFMNAVFDYHSSMGKFSDEDVEYIEKCNEPLYVQLGQLVDHYEVQIWDGPEGDVIYCTDYFSYESAKEAYRIFLKDEPYIRLVEVDSDGMPIEYGTEEYSW